LRTDLQLVVGSAFIGEDLEYVEGPLTISILPDGTINGISRGAASGRGAIDLRGLTALPPLANLHTHILDLAIAEEGWDLDIDSVVGEPYGLKYVLLRRAGRELYLRAVHRFLKLSYRMGVGYVVEFRELGPEALAIDYGSRPYGHVVLGMPSSHDRDVVKAEVGALSVMSDGLAISSPNYFSPETIEYVSRFFKGKFIASHVAETREVRECGDLEALLRAVKPTAVVHGTWLTEEDLQLLKELGVAIVSCPRSNRWFLSGTSPIDLMYRVGVKVGFGTDNAGWVKNDLWREGEEALLIMRSRGVNDPRWVLKSLTVNAGIFGFKNYICEGCPASLLLLKTSVVGLDVVRNKYLGVVKRGGPEAVSALVVGGTPRWCLRDASTLCNSLRNHVGRREDSFEDGGVEA